jgi:dephospho-CoA kinase
MTVIGLTGGVGMGKSTAASLLERHGVAVCDTDALARQVVEAGQPALKDIGQTFGAQVIGPDGHLRRDALAKIVFADPQKRQQLEAITHPRIRRLWLAQVDAWRAEGKSRAVVTIPLLFETNAAPHFDAVICVACTAATQRQRLSRRGWGPEEIERRNAAQWPTQKKVDLSDYVIWTEAGLEVHEAQLLRILESLSRRSETAEKRSGETTSR